MGYTDDLNQYSKSGFHIPLIARFSASSDYNEFFERMSQSKERLVSSTAECVVYDAAMDLYAKPPVTSDFSLAIKQLPALYGDGEAFFDFLDNFGTHTVQKAKMGSRYGFNSYFREMSWTNVERYHTSVTHAASVFGFYHATGQSNTSTEVNIFKENMDGFKEISLGVKPPLFGDAKAWAAQVVREPMPISYELTTICESISDASKKASCKKAQTRGEYCTKRLKEKRKVISDCTNIPYFGCLWDGDCQKGVCVDYKCSTNPEAMVWRPSNNSLCLSLSSNRLIVEACNAQAANQKWIFNSGEYQNYMQIQYAADTTLCVDGNSLANGQPLTVSRCSGSPSQTWARDISMGAIYSPNGKDGNVCMDAGSGIKAGSPMLVWQCNVLPQQQFDVAVQSVADSLAFVFV